MKAPLTFSSKRAAGFTMIELLVGSTVMLVAVLGALFIYSRSNKVSVEQQMVTEVQNDVRSSMFFLSRDLRMAGAGLPERVRRLVPRRRRTTRTRVPRSCPTGSR